MFKTALTLSMAASATASAATMKVKADLNMKVKADLNVHNFMKKLTPHAATEQAVAAKSLKTSENPIGTFLVGQSYPDDDCTKPIAEVVGFRNGVCSASEQLDGTVKYNIYSCDTSTDGTITMYQSRYSDAACTQDESVQTPQTIAGDTCIEGIKLTCPVDENSEVTSKEAFGADRQNGVMFTASGTKEFCETGSFLNAYMYSQGCDGDGMKYNECSAEGYLTEDCTGTPLLTVMYDTLDEDEQCTLSSIVDDDGDGDDMFPSHDQSYVRLYVPDCSDDDACFHSDTMIDYKGVEYTYEELKAGKEPECTVPHSPASKGVVITTSCDKTVRVTDTHLMATTKGFQLAYSLKAGDVMYGDYGKETCIVKSVEKEKTTQQYFGLNCVHSEVLASGIRASTFGDFHTLPSWYMTYVGGLVGSEAASSLGEYIAEWYFQK